MGVVASFFFNVFYISRALQGLKKQTIMLCCTFGALIIIATFFAAFRSLLRSAGVAEQKAVHQCIAILRHLALGSLLPSISRVMEVHHSWFWNSSISCNIKVLSCGTHY